MRHVSNMLSDVWQTAAEHQIRVNTLFSALATAFTLLKQRLCMNVHARVQTTIEIDANRER